MPMFDVRDHFTVGSYYNNFVDTYYLTFVIFYTIFYTFSVINNIIVYRSLPQNHRNHQLFTVELTPNKIFTKLNVYSFNFFRFLKSPNFGHNC